MCVLNMCNNTYQCVIISVTVCSIIQEKHQRKITYFGEFYSSLIRFKDSN